LSTQTDPLSSAAPRSKDQAPAALQAVPPPVWAPVPALVPGPVLSLRDQVREPNQPRPPDQMMSVSWLEQLSPRL
jgi:hypothetical protein